MCDIMYMVAIGSAHSVCLFGNVHFASMYMYRIAGKISGGSIFTDVHDHAITAMYKRAYFVGLIFTVHESTVKTTRIGPLEISRYTVLMYMCHT